MDIFTLMSCTAFKSSMPLDTLLSPRPTPGRCAYFRHTYICTSIPRLHTCPHTVCCCFVPWILKASQEQSRVKSMLGMPPWKGSHPCTEELSSAVSQAAA